MSAADFTGGVLPGGAFSFAPGEIWTNVSVTVLGDRVLLSSPSAGMQIATGRAEATILPDVPTISLTTAAMSREEGVHGTRNFAFTVELNGPLATVTEASWSVAVFRGSADRDDFVGGWFPSGRVSIAAGATQATINVPVRGDTAPENDEQFTLILAGPSPGVVLGRASATGTILNDDGAFVMASAGGPGDPVWAT